MELNKKDKLIEKAERLLANGKPIADKFVVYNQPYGVKRYILLLEYKGVYFIVTKKGCVNEPKYTYSVWQFVDLNDAIECYEHYFAKSQRFDPALN